MSKSLCIIPARSGSKRLPGKNIKQLFGKPLVCHTIDLAIGEFQKIIVSMDNEEDINLISDRYKNIRNLVFDKRPSYLATDYSRVIDTVRYYVKKEQGGDEYNHTLSQVWLLLPTCPLRTKEDFKTIKEFLTEDVDSVISVTDYDLPPQMSLQMTSNGLLKEYDVNMPYSNDNTRSQEFTKLYRPNGAFYGAQWRVFLNSTQGKKRFIDKEIKTRAYYMPKERSIDIDTYHDLRIAEFLLSSNIEK